MQNSLFFLKNILGFPTLVFKVQKVYSKSYIEFGVYFFFF